MVHHVIIRNDRSNDGIDDPDMGTEATVGDVNGQAVKFALLNNPLHGGRVGKPQRTTSFS